jgi:hypothetical protein
MFEELAIHDRNREWEGHDAIPKWVDLSSVGLDQFFTNPRVADYCYKSLISFLNKKKVNHDAYTFIEPSAGIGSFYELLPTDRRVGLDIMPMHEEVKKQDFLTWEPEKKSSKKLIFIGNPPFGYRAWLALAFVNHAAKFADYVGFILPMAFQSEGKGSAKHRVNGMRLVHSEIIPADSFFNPDGTPFKVNALWQIWEKGENTKPQKKTCKGWIDLFTVDMRKERLCGHERMDEADFFIQRTFFSSPPTLVRSFSEVKYVCGYGIVIKRDREKVIRTLLETDWRLYSNLAAHNCRHISMYHIIKALTDKGISDE